MIIDEKSPVWDFLDPEQKDLFLDASHLIHVVQGDSRVLSDYSFMVAPVAKAYEGFLKKLFFQYGFISEHEYKGKKFRVGRALNPNLETDLRHESVYDRLVEFCGGSTEIPDSMWEAWKNGRNKLFHYFPDHLHCISKDEALERIEEISQVMEDAMTCFVRGEGKV